jgi:two-component system, OmpR family, sensor histidine kinase KdpD
MRSSVADQRAASEPRSWHDARSDEARRGKKGRVGGLKIFVGAAPGVGKTYQMLQTARSQLKEGGDVVVGVVETHGRKETEALLEGFEVIPRKQTVDAHRIPGEFDLDAALKRRPAQILIDELAHTNLSRTRHPKRYQDVEELLDAGIDVYTTVNIQHIECLNDVVAAITHVRVREVVPDALLNRANEIELVDFTPEDLIQRLKDGKVYIPRQAEHALRHYFSATNLTALRELALRHAADWRRQHDRAGEGRESTEVSTIWRVWRWWRSRHWR